METLCTDTFQVDKAVRAATSVTSRGLDMSGTSLRVGVDLDGVWHDFAGSLRYFLQTSHANKPFGDGTYPEPLRWDFYLDWGLTLEDFLQACHDGVDAGIVFSHGDPNEGSREVFESIRAAGHSIHVVTDRPFGTNGASEAATRSWLDHHGLAFDSLTFSGDKTIVNTDIFIEDKPENYTALDACGVEVWLVNRAWNESFDAERRLNNINEYVGKVADLAERKVNKQ